MQIKLTEETTEVTVDNYLKNGGGTKQEWPWKLLYDNQGAGDKWASYSMNGWIVFKFKKPILIRGFGLKSANDCPDRDPKHIKFMVHDVFDERPKKDQNYIEVFKANDQKFTKRWQTKVYRLERTWMVHSVKLYILENHGDNMT